MFLDYQELTQYILAYGEIVLYLALVIGLIFLICYGIVKNNYNYVTRGFVFLIVGSVLTLILVIITIVDTISNQTGDTGLFSYIALIAIIVIFTICFSVPSIIRGKTRYQRLTFKKRKPSVNRDVIQHVYLVFKCRNNIILKKNKEEISGFDYKMDKHHLFKDEIIKEVLKDYNVSLVYDEPKEVGIATVNSKKPNLYNCFLVEVNDISEELAKEFVVDQFDIINLEIDDFNKKLILKTLMREEFRLYL